ncbi:integrase catalytic domain-containing protein [Trichonephila clavipes]|nr:integrase catalytic domain-containing protein [Trichonephila clavipes]
MATDKAELINLYKKKRTTLRASVTKIISKIEIQKTELTGESEIDLYIGQLNDKFESLKLVDKELEKVLNPQDVDKELQSAEEYQDKIVTWSFKAKKYLRNLNPRREIFMNLKIPTNHPKPEVNFSHQTHSVTLPKITILKFSGNISEWLTFWNSYETSIDKNESLDNVSKFNYLKTHLTGTALETIGCFSISQENYVKAIDLLEQRFGRKETLINIHMNQLETLPLRRSNDVKSFRQLFDKIQINIRRLEYL